MGQRLKTSRTDMKDLSQSRILLVDDVKANLEVLLGGLKDEYKLSVALNGPGALDLVGRVSPDLVLLDVNMPGMDGYEVCRRLRARRETADLPIVFVSALDEISNKARGFEAGGNDYITKPFDLLEVKARVRALLKARAYNEAAKEQLAGELRVAREIQMGMLPREFSTVEREYGVSLGASLIPAGEVGGDLFAVFGVDADRFVVAMGDVSGKGIPAALFMVRVLTMLRLLARNSSAPADILSRLNEELAVDNPSCMFVTILCVVYNVRTRKAAVASGGQPGPILLRPGEKPHCVLNQPGTALGLDLNVPFSSVELTLNPSDTLLFYTDGVTEARNQKGELYDTTRLLHSVGEATGEQPAALVDKLLRQVEHFATGARQADDIALVALRV
jgi:phosphoserine phosphatase RsbU/P